MVMFCFCKMIIHSSFCGCCGAKLGAIFFTMVENSSILNYVHYIVDIEVGGFLKQNFANPFSRGRKFVKN